MPIEINRIDRQCPKCKNPKIFDIGKKFVCGKCMSDINKDTMEVIMTVDDIFFQGVRCAGKEEIGMESTDVIIDPQIMVDTTVSTVAM